MCRNIRIKIISVMGNMYTTLKRERKTDRQTDRQADRLRERRASQFGSTPPLR